MGSHRHCSAWPGRATRKCLGWGLDSRESSGLPQPEQACLCFLWSRRNEKSCLSNIVDIKKVEHAVRCIFFFFFGDKAEVTLFLPFEAVFSTSPVTHGSVPELSHLINLKMYPLVIISVCLFRLAPGNHYYTPCCEFQISWCLVRDGIGQQPCFITSLLHLT